MTPSLKLMTLLLVLIPVGIAACGDDGNVLGTDGNAGMAGQASGGGAAGTTGSGRAGGMAKSGANAGGTSSSGGKAGTGGGAACDIPECLRANVCLDHCGGKVVYTGCCACAAPAVDELSCMTAAGGQGAGGAGSAQDCVGMTCSVGEACVAHRTVGGAIDPPGTAGCMSGKHVENAQCQSDFKYACAALTCAAPGPSCHCAPGTSCAYATSCRLPKAAAWLDTDADLVCEQQVP